MWGHIRQSTKWYKYNKEVLDRQINTHMTDGTSKSTLVEAYYFDKRSIITWNISKLNVYIHNFKDMVYEFIEI